MREKINMCEVIQDLLPLYEDDCCSSQSRALVEEHLKTCEVCRKKRASYEKCMPKMEESEKEDIRGIRQGIRVFVRWRTIGRTVVGLILAAVFLVIPVWNQVRGMGLTYANLGAVHRAYAFERALASGDYERAYGYLDMEFRYEDLVSTEPAGSPADPDSRRNTEAITAGIREVEEKGFAWYDEVCREAFLENMQTLEEKNERIRSCSNLRIQRETYGWRVCLDVRTEAGTDLVLWMDLTGNGIRDYSAALSRRALSERICKETEELDKEGKMYEVLYQPPSINETIMKILYENTDYDWRLLFEYESPVK